MDLHSSISNQAGDKADHVLGIPRQLFSSVYSLKQICALSHWKTLQSHPVLLIKNICKNVWNSTYRAFLGQIQVIKLDCNQKL